MRQGQVTRTHVYSLEFWFFGGVWDLLRTALPNLAGAFSGADMGFCMTATGMGYEPRHDEVDNLLRAFVHVAARDSRWVVLRGRGLSYDRLCTEGDKPC